MSKELADISKELRTCPICDVSNSFKISGFIMKNLECKSCKAQWSAGTYNDGERWLKLMRVSKTGLGEAKSGVLYRDFPLEFWVNKDKPAFKVESYAKAIYEVFQNFENFKQEHGNAEFKDGNAGVWFIGPTIDVVATINLTWNKKNGDYDISMSFIDQTSMIDEKNRDKNDLFLYMIAKQLFILLEDTGISIIPYTIPNGKNEGEKVKENWFYPFKDLDVRPVTVIGEFGKEVLQAFRQLKPKKAS